MTEGSHTIAARRRPFRLGAVVAVALLVGFVLWLVFRDGGSPSSSSPVPKGLQAVPISVDGLQTIASLGIPLYWAGERPGTTYELSKTSDDRVYIRYLPAGVEIGAARPYLTIGTYPVENAFAVTKRLAALPTSVRLGIGNRAVAFYHRDKPTSVFIAYPRLNYQIEVFDPSPGRARTLVVSRQIEAVQ